MFPNLATLSNSAFSQTDMEILAIIGYQGLPMKENSDIRLSIVKYVSALEWSLSLEWIFKWNTYDIQLWNTYEISKLNTGSNFWAFDCFPQLFLWVFPTIFLLKLFFYRRNLPSPLIFGSMRGNLVLVEGIIYRIFLKGTGFLPPSSIPGKPWLEIF